MSISRFNLEDLDDSIFHSVADEYKAAIKEVSDLMKTGEFLNQARPWPDPPRDFLLLANGQEISRSKRFDYLMEKILNLLTPIISKNITNFYCIPWYVTVQRTLLSPPQPEDCGSAWQWHFDGVPMGTFKIFIYINDVKETSAPFCFMGDKDGNPIKYDTGDWNYISCSDDNSKVINPPRGTKTRITPDETRQMIKSGEYFPQKVTMPAGSFMVWNPNYLHKATNAEKETRDVIQFHMRPTLQKPPSYWHGTNGREHHVYYKHDWWLSDRKLHNWGKE